MKRLFLTAIAAILFSISAHAGDIKIKQGETIAFLGDSITEYGNWEGGYVPLVIEGLHRSGIDVKAIPAGISGHKSCHMLNRVDKDVIAKHPDWMILSCGVNDVWHFWLIHPKAAIPLEDYRKNITAICDKAASAGIKIIIMTATMIGEDPGNAANKKLIAYNDFLRALAKERGYLLIDQNRRMQEIVTAARKADPAGKRKII